MVFSLLIASKGERIGKMNQQRGAVYICYALQVFCSYLCHTAFIAGQQNFMFNERK